MGCRFLLQCVKVKSESEVAQLCPTLSDPMDCSLPTRLLCPWDFPGKSTGVGCHCLFWALVLLDAQSQQPVKERGGYRQSGNCKLSVSQKLLCKSSTLWSRKKPHGRLHMPSQTQISQLPPPPCPVTVQHELACSLRQEAHSLLM